MYIATYQRVFPFGEKSETYYEVIQVGCDGDLDLKAYREAELRRVKGFKLQHLYRIHSEVKIS